MAVDWSNIFDSYGTKVVTKTDKEKGAYVLNEAQRDALAAANITPTEGPSDRIIKLEVIFDETVAVLNVSYYNSLRAGAGRMPEARMGREIIGWMDEGDALTIGQIGAQVFTLKDRPALIAVGDDEKGRVLSRSVRKQKILAKAKLASGKPNRRSREISDFVRNPYVVAAALARAAGQCEMPDCTASLFVREDGVPYLEVHHIRPLSEDGDDTLENAVALCPACHRELHYGKDRMSKRSALKSYISQKNESWAID